MNILSSCRGSFQYIRGWNKIKARLLLSRRTLLHVLPLRREYQQLRAAQTAETALFNTSIDSRMGAKASGRLLSSSSAPTKKRVKVEVTKKEEDYVQESLLGNEWVALGTPRTELTLEFTMNIGQSFRWRSIDVGSDNIYVGVLGHHVIALKHHGDDVFYKILGCRDTKDTIYTSFAEQLEDYFNLGRVPLTILSESWKSADAMYADWCDIIPGARMLRQDPVECLFSFICSQNNHISRIHGMVNKLASMYGTRIDVGDAEEEISIYTSLYGTAEFYEFPSLEQLSHAREEDLRDAGFGYRAKFIEGSVKALLDMPQGGLDWLLSLRHVSFDKAIEELCILPGVGPKVAACVALFSLDKHSSIPVDTHVWQLALRHYTPHLRGKTNSPKYHPEIQKAFVERFGEYAGWAHNTLFISELASVKKKLKERNVISDDEDSFYSDSEDETSSSSSSALSLENIRTKTPPKDNETTKRHRK